MVKLLMLMMVSSSSADITINSDSFPDKNFRTYVTKLEKEHGNGDGIFSDDEISLITEIDVFDHEIYSLDGLE